MVRFLLYLEYDLGSDTSLNLSSEIHIEFLVKSVVKSTRHLGVNVFSKWITYFFLHTIYTFINISQTIWFTFGCSTFAKVVAFEFDILDKGCTSKEDFQNSKSTTLITFVTVRATCSIGCLSSINFSTLRSNRLSARCTILG